MPPDNSPVSEGSPLLRRTVTRSGDLQTSTPVPKLQLFNALLVELCVALEWQSSLPYVIQFVSGMDIVGGDKGKAGYYVGLLLSFRSVASMLSMLPLSRLSDHIGRKPVILTGMVASTVSVLSFGLSRTFLGLVVSACIGGLFNGNLGVVRTVLGEITDSTNRARAFAWSVLPWSIGGGISSLIGGYLSTPSDRFPDIFTGEFWKRYPYFLPCFVIAVIIILSFLMVLFSFHETLTNRPRDPEESLPLHKDPPPIWTLLTPPVLITIVNVSCFEFLGMSLETLVTLFLATPIESGGLALDSVTIGYILGSYRIFAAVFMIFWCPWIVHRLGERRAFEAAIYSTMFAWVVLPIANTFAYSITATTTTTSMTVAVWICVALLAVPLSFVQMGLVCISVYITAASPSKDSLGALNGLARTTAAVADVIAPAVAASLFTGWKGSGGYGVLFGISCFAVWLARGLPHGTRAIWEGEL